MSGPPDSEPQRSGPEVTGTDLETRLQFAFAATALKDVERAGWVLRGVERPESVADHSFGTAVLCLLYAEQSGLDLGRALAVALVHDIAEVVTGDHVARADPADREVSEQDKAAAELRAIDKLPAAEGALEAWREYEDRSTPEALFVRDMNLIDMCLQALRYESERRYDASRPVPSAGGYVHLDEFFASAGGRLTTEVGKRLFSQVESAYRELRSRYHAKRR